MLSWPDRAPVDVLRRGARYVRYMTELQRNVSIAYLSQSKSVVV